MKSLRKILQEAFEAVQPSHEDYEHEYVNLLKNGIIHDRQAFKHLKASGIENVNHAAMHPHLYDKEAIKHFNLFKQHQHIASSYQSQARYLSDEIKRRFGVTYNIGDAYWNKHIDTAKALANQIREPKII